MTTASHLSRVLNLVPYLSARPGISIDTAAADLGISVSELRDDLTMLWMCGLPGYGPGDLIDIAFDDDTVTVTYDAGMTRPVRLLPDEALALVVALRMLADTPGLADRDAVRRTLDKVAAAAGDAATAAARVSVSTTVDDKSVDTYRRIVSQGKAVRLTYYSAGRDRTTERIVDPIRVVLADDHAYLHAWCRSAEDVRRFRLDRIDAHTVLDERATVPAHARDLTDAPGAIFASGALDLPTVVLRVNRSARWISEYYPCEDVTVEPDGRWTVSLRARDLDWAKRLVLGLGTEAEVVSPAGLRDAVLHDARRALAAYDESLR
ncbi:MAG TPA: WYL domain-containing protein [Stackebrandtia sp.]|jgi:proteasome accessory factor C|uniref:helix-turn-helix transcriptional regulator n=1 Tax=Stackebrandtia sp. TaxID=2023065 RepID=UPI002D52CDB3|nr:WYL domain-containing protein [Stackebrandtia sp.]HZE38270.1 WYL domain-containing protein [Stackebrandtia sp.]